LDVVGERWSLLIVRELMLGPRRYSDLYDGLPGVPTNLLASRLKDLRNVGVITKRTLPAPARVAVYELTEAGHELRSALAELRSWGTRFGPPPAETAVVRPAWVLMSACSRPVAVPPGRTCELRVGAEVFRLASEESGLSVRAGEVEAPDAVLNLDADTLYALIAGRVTAVTAGRHGVIDGERDVAMWFLDSLHGALTTETAHAATRQAPT